MMRNFPFIVFLSVPTMLSLVACVCNHIVWFRYFIDQQRSRDYNRDELDILQTVGFFLVMVWMIPGGLFVSLTINDSSLPVSGGGMGVGVGAGAGVGVGMLGGREGGAGKKGSVFKKIYDSCQSFFERVTNAKLSPSSVLDDRKNTRLSKYS